MTQQSFVTSIGRMVKGSLYKPNDKDATGNPRVIKKGANAGKLTQVFEFAVAFPKVPGQHWATSLMAQLPNGQVSKFGEIIYTTGVQGFPQGQHQIPTFAWKITDGDSQIPNTRGNKPCDQEGYPGHWVLWFSSQYAPKVVNKDGSAYILEKDVVKPGYYVQVQGTVDSNDDLMKPGIYLNHSVVSLQGYGEEIKTGPDPLTIGFGAGPALPGMQPAPVGGMSAPAAPMPLPLPGMLPVAPQPPPAAPQMPPVAIAPHPGFLQPPPVGAAVPAPMAPPAPVMPSIPLPPAAPIMTAKAQGATYQQFVAQGWKDADLRAQGFMV